MILVGHIVKEADGGAMVYVPYPAGQRKPDGCHESVGVEFVDKRRISDFLHRRMVGLHSTGSHEGNAEADVCGRG